MPRESFQQELDSLVGEVLDLGREVGASLENMVKAMETGDAELASRELGVDLRYKARGAEVDRDSMILQARQAPVAGDLRLLYTVQSVTNHLVRSGAPSAHLRDAAGPPGPGRARPRAPPPRPFRDDPPGALRRPLGAHLPRPGRDGRRRAGRGPRGRPGRDGPHGAGRLARGPRRP